jgi:hypothetical protein
MDIIRWSCGCIRVTIGVRLATFDIIFAQQTDIMAENYNGTWEGTIYACARACEEIVNTDVLVSVFVRVSNIKDMHFGFVTSMQ